MNIMIDGQIHTVEQFSKFKYLTAGITEDQRCETQIKNENRNCKVRL